MVIDSDKLAMQCIKAALFVSVLITVGFWGNWWVVVGAWVAMYPMAMVFGLIVGFVGAALGWETESEAQVWADETKDLIAESSPETVGKFQDADIHEWVMLKRPDNGELVRCMFDRTIDMRGDFEFQPPEGTWFCITPPGILYVAVHPGNAAPQA